MGLFYIVFTASSLFFFQPQDLMHNLGMLTLTTLASHFNHTKLKNKSILALNAQSHPQTAWFKSTLNHHLCK